MKTDPVLARLSIGGEALHEHASHEDLVRLDMAMDRVSAEYIYRTIMIGRALCFFGIHDQPRDSLLALRGVSPQR